MERIKIITARDARLRALKNIETFEHLIERIERDIKHAARINKAFHVQIKINSIYFDNIRDYLKELGYKVELNRAPDPVYETIYININW